MIGIATEATAVSSSNLSTDKRAAERRAVSLPARLTWKDARGTMRFATGVARNVSDFGVYIECQTPVSLPLYRIVQVQIERDGRRPRRSPRRCCAAACFRRCIGFLPRRCRNARALRSGS